VSVPETLTLSTSNFDKMHFNAIAHVIFSASFTRIVISACLLNWNCFTCVSCLLFIQILLPKINLLKAFYVLLYSVDSASQYNLCK
jgi:ABC-type uncharacterized transport system YnjBCD permease subunit